LSTATVDVILHLINSKCVPVLLYGLEVCLLNKADIQSLDFCVSRLLMKLFCTNNLSVIEACRHYFNIALPSELLCMRAEKFLLKLNANNIVDTCYRHLFYFIYFVKLSPLFDATSLWWNKDGQKLWI